MDKIKEPSIDLTLTNMEDTSIVSEPETFDTWTIITDPMNNFNKSESNETINGNRIEILKCKPEIRYVQELENNDELSDGISIISDSESAGRSSPLPLYITENNKEKKEVENRNKETQYTPITPTHSTTNESFSQTVSSNETDIVDKQFKKCCQEISHQTDSLPLTEISVKSSIFTTRNISLFFYLSASIAIIAFIGKTKYPEWGKTLQEEVIHQRVDDLELQNNLLRAEIDILSKQVQYLNKETESHSKSYKSDTIHKHNDNRNYVKKEKIKVWPGNGKIERTEIPKEALKMPHSCDKYVQNSESVCMDSEPNNEENKKTEVPPKEFENIVKDSIEKIVPVAVHENIVNKFKTKENDNIPDKHDYVKYSEHNSKNINNKEKHKKYDKYNNQKGEEHHNINDKHINQSNDEMTNNNFNDKLEKRDKKEKKFREDYQNREQDHKKENLREKYDEQTPETKMRNKYDSSEKYHNKEDYIKNSKAFQEDYENNSKEKYYKKNSKNKKSFDDEKSDEFNKQKKYDKIQHDDWHENMMKNRDEYRRKQHNEKWRSENWYIDRASGREEARIFEKDHHKFKKMRRQ